MKRAYVAGALNSEHATGYLQNVSKMLDTAEQLRLLGVAPFKPAEDLLSGIKFGYYEYDDVFDPSQAWLDVSDFVYLTPGWEDSPGTRREIERASRKGIPVFMDIDEVKQFLKPVIVCIVGESGSGKSLMAEWFEKLFHYNLIVSYTTRPMRSPNEKGHTFIDDAMFDTFSHDDMIAYTKFGDYRYCCLKQDVQDYNTYVIDENGLQMLREKYSDTYHIYAIRVYAKPVKGLLTDFASSERILRDKGRFTMSDNEFDFVFKNSYDLSKLINFVQVTHNAVHSDFISKCYYV